MLFRSGDRLRTGEKTPGTFFAWDNVTDTPHFDRAIALRVKDPAIGGDGQFHWIFNRVLPLAIDQLIGVEDDFAEIAVHLLTGRSTVRFGFGGLGGRVNFRGLRGLGEGRHRRKGKDNGEETNFYGIHVGENGRQGGAFIQPELRVAERPDWWLDARRDHAAGEAEG